MFQKLIFLILPFLTALYADEYKEFQELCNDVRVASFVTVSKQHSLEQSIDIAKMKIYKDLAEEFTGVLVDSSFIMNEKENKDGYKEEMRSYLKTQTIGWIFPKYLYLYDNGTSYYKYDKQKDLLTINAKLKCNKRVFRELKNKLDIKELNR